MYSLKMDLNFEVDFAPFGIKELSDGEDVTELLSTPHKTYLGPEPYALCKGYEGQFFATVLQGKGSGGGNPFVEFLWYDYSRMVHWLTNRVLRPAGMSFSEKVLKDYFFEEVWE
jgi:hypothetical protein